MYRRNMSMGGYWTVRARDAAQGDEEKSDRSQFSGDQEVVSLPNLAPSSMVAQENRASYRNEDTRAKKDFEQPTGDRHYYVPSATEEELDDLVFLAEKVRISEALYLASIRQPAKEPEPRRYSPPCISPNFDNYPRPEDVQRFSKSARKAAQAASQAGQNQAGVQGEPGAEGQIAAENVAAAEDLVSAEGQAAAGSQPACESYPDSQGQTSAKGHLATQGQAAVEGQHAAEGQLAAEDQAVARSERAAQDQSPAPDQPAVRGQKAAQGQPTSQGQSTSADLRSTLGRQAGKSQRAAKGQPSLENQAATRKKVQFVLSEKAQGKSRRKLADAMKAACDCGVPSRPPTPHPRYALNKRHTKK